MKFSARHRPLEFLSCDDLPEKRVGRQQDVVVEEDVVDAHDPFFTQDDIRFLGVAAVHCQSETEVSVVIEIGAGGDDPINESTLDQWNQRRHSESSRCQRAGDRQSDRDVGLQHLFGE